MAERSAEREIQELLEFRCVRRLRTVHALLQEANGLGLLADALMEKATAEIVAGARARHDIQRDIKQKERAREILVKKYKTAALPEVRSAPRACLCSRCSQRHHRYIPAALQPLGRQGSPNLGMGMGMGPHEDEGCPMTICKRAPLCQHCACESCQEICDSAAGMQEDILRCLYSISDNNSFLLFNRDPVDRMIEYLHAYFRPDYAESGASLAISGGLAGARLTHNHERQFHYVLQSLTLWREISHDVSIP